jgi:tape measure domain-containing protein
MNRVYSFAIKMQDLFSPQMLRLATQYEQKTSFMGRVWSKFEGMLKSSMQTVNALRGKLSGLASGFRVRLDSSDIDKANSKTSGLLSKLKSIAGQSAIIGGLVGGGAMGLIDTVINQFGKISDKTIGASGRNKTTMFTLNELMGKPAAAALASSVDKYAPEKRDQLLTSAQKLSGSGVEGSKLMDTLKYLNNISALTNSNVDDLAMIQSKIKATGYVQGDEINMFKERGINLNPYLAKVMGAKEGDISKLQSKGLITYDIFDKAMQYYAGKGSKYENVYERKMTSTPEGKQDLISGKFDALMRGYGDKMAPFQDMVLNMLSDILNGTGPVVMVFQKLWGAISPVFESVGGLLQRLGILNEQGGISQGVFGTLAFLWDYLGKVFEIAGGVIWGVSKAIGWLISNPIAMLILGIYGAVKAWLFLNAAFVATPIGFIITGIVALVAGIMYAWDKFDGFREAVIRVWETVKAVFSNIGEFYKVLFTGTVGDMINLIKKTWKEGIDGGLNAVNIDRQNRKDKAAKGGIPGIEAGAFSGGSGSGTGGGLAGAGGLTTTAGNSKSSSVVINIKSLIEKSEININDFAGNYDELESKLIETLLRVANSGTRAVTA